MVSLLLHIALKFRLSFASLVNVIFFRLFIAEVARTRLREEGHKYRRFFQTISLVYREEGIRNGLYRGLCTQLLRNVSSFIILLFLLI